MSCAASCSTRCPPGTVQWGHKVTGARALGDGRHEVTFADGTSVTTGLLVGADGAWSRIRPLLSAAQPEYVGTSYVETYLYEADTRHPASAQAVGGGALLALAPGRASWPTGNPAPSCTPTWPLTKPAGWFAAIDFADAEAAARVAGEFDGWAPELTALITEGETAPVLRALHTLPARSPLGPGARSDAAGRRRPLDAALRGRGQPGHVRRVRARQRHRRPPGRHRSRADAVRGGHVRPQRGRGRRLGRAAHDLLR